MIDKPLHITVGAVPTVDAGNIRILAHELSIAKAAILYADKVNLCSGGVALATNLHSRLTGNLSLTEQAELFLDFLPVMPFEQDEVWKVKMVAPLLEEFITLSRRNPLLLTRRQRESLREKAPMLEQVLAPLQDQLLEKVKEFGMDEVQPAVEGGVLDIHDFGLGVRDLNNMERMTPKFLELVQETLLSLDTHPLFDPDTARLVERGLASGNFSVAPTAEKRGKQTGLVANLFERLPVLDIPMRELLDVRSELLRPLTHFRAEMTALSSGIASAQWNETFPSDVDDIVQSRINPAIAEIADELERLRLRNFVPSRLVDKADALALGGAAAYGIGAAVAPLAGVLVALGSAAIFTEAAFADFQSRKAAIERNELYFYYRLRELAT